MKVVKWGMKVSKEDPMQHFDFVRFENEAGDFYFIEARFKYTLLREAPLNEKKVVYWYGEEPNRFMSPDTAFRGDEYDMLFYKILTVCPYTADWLNKIQGAPRREVVFVPINEEKVPVKAEKKYDVIYVGNVNSWELDRVIRTISKFSYRFVARSHNVGRMAQLRYKLGLRLDNKYITDQEVTFAEKMRLISESKIAIVHGLLWCSGANLRAVWGTPNIESHGAFALIPKKNWFRYLWSFISSKEYLVPQLKTRFTEAAASRALMLVRKDPFNIVERYYTPGVDFVYYEDGKLEEKINEILANWSAYEQIVENAYQKTMREYTTKSFFEKFLKNIT